MSWELRQDPGGRRVTLRWQESGGPPVTPPRRKGFGSLLVERILDGAADSARLEFNPDGVACVFEMPLSADNEGRRRSSPGPAED